MNLRKGTSQTERLRQHRAPENPNILPCPVTIWSPDCSEPGAVSFSRPKSTWPIRLLAYRYRRKPASCPPSPGFFTTGGFVEKENISRSPGWTFSQTIKMNELVDHLEGIDHHSGDGSRVNYLNNKLIKWHQCCLLQPSTVLIHFDQARKPFNTTPC